MLLTVLACRINYPLCVLLCFLFCFVFLRAVISAIWPFCPVEHLFFTCFLHVDLIHITCEL